MMLAQIDRESHLTLQTACYHLVYPVNRYRRDVAHPALLFNVHADLDP